MDIFDITGRIVEHFPKFIKDRMEKAVFLQPTEKLPDRQTGTRVAIVVGGATGRVENALRLYKLGIVDYFLVTGGIGPYSVNQQLAEAEIYAETLIKEGVPDNHIWIENESISTPENIKYSMEILLREAKQLPHGYLQPIIITSGFHLKRTVALFEKALKDARYGSESSATIVHAYWSASRFTPCEIDTWRTNRIGCAFVAKEAIRLFTYRLTGKI